MKQKKQKKFAEKKEEEGRLVLVLRRTGKGPEDYDFLPAKVKNQQPAVYRMGYISGTTGTGGFRDLQKP